MPDTTPEETYFAFFTEVGILAQLSRALFEARLPDGFTLSQFTVLNHLIRVKDGRTPLEMARAFQVPKTSMTHSLAVLERHGLIRLAPNLQDGRSKCVWITDAGRTFRQAAISGMTPDLADLAARFPALRLAETLPVLTDLRQIMDQMRDPDPEQRSR
ncbi:MarR family transcriptional regulator [Tabrizicola sp.]|uniref:MarR family winged helix-turn-helix transcriptional regulator n=1 Tax=Tabrizicola sp. TaxID=2005166 RepID=UPI00286C88C2|nr:MarR family transcriptional regulator [Tabrizicola sp.]